MNLSSFSQIGGCPSLGSTSRSPENGRTLTNRPHAAEDAAMVLANTVPRNQRPNIIVLNLHLARRPCPFTSPNKLRTHCRIPKPEPSR